MAKRKAKARRRALRIRTINLKSIAASESKLRTALRKASRSKVAIIVLNAPFKLGTAQPNP